MMNQEQYGLDDVIIDAILNKPDKEDFIVDLFFVEDYRALHILKCHFDSTVNFSFPEIIIDDILTCIYEVDFFIGDHGEHVSSSASMSGADPAAYENGEWSADLYEFLGYYLWIEPEGETYGYFKTEKEAQDFGDSNWAP
jgi:hypothetical protein